MSIKQAAPSLSYKTCMATSIQRHRHFSSLPRDLQFRIQNYMHSDTFGTVELIAVETYLNHLYPLGYRLQDSVDSLIQDELGSERPFIIHSG